MFCHLNESTQNSTKDICRKREVEKEDRQHGGRGNRTEGDAAAIFQTAGGRERLKKRISKRGSRVRENDGPDAERRS